MKYIIIAGVVIVTGVGVFHNIGNTTEVKNVVEEVIVEIEVTPEWAEDEDAVQAAQDVLRRKELQAELRAVQSDIEALEARETEIEKELGTY